MNNFFERKSQTFSFSAFKRLVLSELSYKGAFTPKMVLGIPKRQITRMVEHPEFYGSKIIHLSRYMMLKSGYYKRLIEYFVNMGVINWCLDTEVKSAGFYDVSEKTLKSNYIKCAAQCNKFKIDENITGILKKMYVEDICFGFIEENDIDCSIFFIDPEYCKIKKIVNGNVYQYAVDRSLIGGSYFKTMPAQLREIIENSKEISKNDMVMIPYENSLCLKYNDDFPYAYPPFFNLIADILLIDDYKELSKAKTEADAYKLVYYKIPTDDDGKISMSDTDIIPFVSMTKDIIPESWGVVPSPMDLQLIEAKSTVSDDTNKTQEAVENYYGEAGVSKALISSASSGSELKLSMKVDSSDLYRIYRRIQSWMDLQLKLRGFIYKSYQFVYYILPVTIFDVNDYIDKQLKLAQASIPNKSMLMAANGINTSKLLGNSYMENVVLKDIFDTWKPLSTSYTQSVSEDGGRPELDETEISKATDIQRQSDSNKTDNRI